jgi:hypothetical protein
MDELTSADRWSGRRQILRVIPEAPEALSGTHTRRVAR